MGEGRNARATRFRARRVSECPPMIHPRESPSATGLPQSFSKPETLTFSLNPLSNGLLRAAIKNQHSFVQNLWTT